MLKQNWTNTNKLEYVRACLSCTKICTNVFFYLSEQVQTCPDVYFICQNMFEHIQTCI